MIINFIIVYPQRLAFLLIYNLSKIKSKDGFKNIIKGFMILIIIGIPFMYINILYILFKKKNIENT